MITEHSLPRLETVAVGSPITRLGVSFHPVYVGGNPLPEIATGDSSGLVVEELETAAVETLSARNPTKTPILIVEGEHLIGGKQNRNVNVTVLVPPMTNLEIPVTCVEQGRWDQAREYRRAPSLTPRRVRLRNQAAVHESMRATGSRHGDQGAVWDAVDEVLGDLDTESETSAVADGDAVYQRDGRRLRAAEELASLGPLPAQCGIAVSHGRHVVAIELFGSHSLLASHWSAVIRSHLLEPVRPEGRPSATAVLELFRLFGRVLPRQSPGIGLGHEHRVKHVRIVGQALTLDSSIVHASAFRPSSGTRSRRSTPAGHRSHRVRR